ncbi:hypothetical protein ES288_A07G057700v1 [Gossypium darwinii]|uniref:Uncharacterized protein n=1 Tax=Gossypium darwinii TaxID=34276 RepID=A0A5D2FU81_GOSDA|nr:hypothetical protein ES288_A07G057700v1 [Gossypium darwinii]
MEWVMVTDSREAHLENIFFECSSMEEVVDIVVDIENYFPSMVERYGAKWLLRELRNELKLLIDGEREVIMLESLKTKSVMLGRSDMEDDEIVCMLSESDLDGDCALNQVKFYNHLYIIFIIFYNIIRLYKFNIFYFTIFMIFNYYLLEN